MNVVGSRPDGWWRDRPGAMRRLVASLEDYAAATPEEDVLVVFDGAPFEVDTTLVEVRFASRRGRDAADDDIAEMAAPGVTVVSSDADLERRVRERGGDVIGAGAFRRQLGSP